MTAPVFLPPATTPRPAPYTTTLHPGRFRAASVLAPMPPRVPRNKLQLHPPTTAWRAATYYTDHLVRTER